MEVKVPKNQWDVYTITYKTPVKCPRCGQTTYVDLMQYGPKYTEYPWAKNKDWTQDHCDLCGELLVVYMTEAEGTKEQLDQAVLKALDIQPRTVYKVQAINDKSTQASRNYARIMPYSPVLFGEDTFIEDWYQLIVFDDKDSDGVIIHCGSVEDCKKYLAENFFIFEEA